MKNPVFVDKATELIKQKISSEIPKHLTKFNITSNDDLNALGVIEFTCWNEKTKCENRGTIMLNFYL